MISHKEIEDFVLSMPNAARDYPFGEDIAVYKVFVPDKPSTLYADGVQGAGEQRSESYKKYGERAAESATQQSTASTGRVSGSAGNQGSAVHGDWKMFALIPEGKTPVSISLKCDPQLSEILRAKYETVLEGYHLNKKHWNTIILTGQLPIEDIHGLIRHSYDLVAKTGADTPKF